MLTVGIPEIATVPETAVVPCGDTGTGWAAVFPTVTVPPTVVVPWAVTGTGASVVFTTLTGDENCACAVAIKHIPTKMFFILWPKSSWATTDADVERSLDAILRAAPG